MPSLDRSVAAGQIQSCKSRCSSAVEQLIRNERVSGSIPLTGSSFQSSQLPSPLFAMKNVSIRRVPYDLTIFGNLKPLIPIGVNVKQISESEHDLQLSNPPRSPNTADLEALSEAIKHYRAADGKDLFSVGTLKANSKRITLVFESSELVSELNSSIKSVGLNLSTILKRLAALGVISASPR